MPKQQHQEQDMNKYSYSEMTQISLVLIKEWGPGAQPDSLSGNIIWRNTQCAKLQNMRFCIHVLNQKV